MVRRTKDRISTIESNFDRIESMIKENSIAAAARACKVDKGFVSKVLRGLANPSIKTGLRLSRFWGITLEELVFYQGRVRGRTSI